MLNRMDIIKRVKSVFAKDKYTIYVDLDGVLCDFEKSVNKISPGILKRHNNDELWDIINKEGSKFWENLDWMPEGKKLWERIKNLNPIILSAHPETKYGEQIANQAITGKRLWIKNNLGGNFSDTAIISTRDQKKNYANTNSILIDDMTKNINEFRDNGGIGILHKSVGKTIEELDKLF